MDFHISLNDDEMKGLGISADFPKDAEEKILSILREKAYSGIKLSNLRNIEGGHSDEYIAIRLSITMLKLNEWLQGSNIEYPDDDTALRKDAETALREKSNYPFRHKYDGDKFVDYKPNFIQDTQAYFSVRTNDMTEQAEDMEIFVDGELNDVGEDIAYYVEELKKEELIHVEKGQESLDGFENAKWYVDNDCIYFLYGNDGKGGKFIDDNERFYYQIERGRDEENDCKITWFFGRIVNGEYQKANFTPEQEEMLKECFRVRAGIKEIYVKNDEESIVDFEKGQTSPCDETFFAYDYGDDKDGGIFIDEDGDNFFYHIEFHYDKNDWVCERCYGDGWNVNDSIKADFTDTQIHILASYLNDKYKIYDAQDKAISSKPKQIEYNDD